MSESGWIKVDDSNLPPEGTLVFCRYYPEFPGDRVDTQRIHLTVRMGDLWYTESGAVRTPPSVWSFGNADTRSMKLSDKTVLFQKKPIAIAASIWHPDRAHYAVDPHPETGYPCKHKDCCWNMGDHGKISTLEGDFIVCPGDWVVTGVKGEHYPCKPDIFRETYTPVLKPNPST